MVANIVCSVLLKIIRPSCTRFFERRKGNTAQEMTMIGINLLMTSTSILQCQVMLISTWIAPATTTTTTTTRPKMTTTLKMTSRSTSKWIESEKKMTRKSSTSVKPPLIDLIDLNSRRMIWLWNLSLLSTVARRVFCFQKSVI